MSSDRITLPEAIKSKWQNFELKLVASIAYLCVCMFILNLNYEAIWTSTSGICIQYEIDALG